MTFPVPDQQHEPRETESDQSEQRERGFGRGRLVVVIISAAVIVLVGAAGSVWWFSGRTNQPNNRGAAPPVSTPRRTPKPKATPTPDTSAYGVGTCLDEPLDPRGGGLELNPVPCDGSSAVLMINQVVTGYNDCQNGADYVNHGFILPDVVANVSYCASLVVPTNQCFEFSTNNSQPIQRTTCGSAPNAVRVESVEPADNVNDACKDQTSPDIWYYQSATSGQYACVSALPPGASTSGQPTTSSQPTTSQPPPL
ncbi:MAG TPA: hypothetical protein VHZ97_15870 [Pseudonocardiaceae bacterium]|nr:hypothetical protein [Pseudonocardiaceae bacterium]